MPNLDAESVRSEIAEAPDAHGLTAEEAAAISALPDQEIDSWIHELAARDDAFWAAYDNLRRRIVAKLGEVAQRQDEPARSTHSTPHPNTKDVPLP